jgi:hypothetical protein
MYDVKIILLLYRRTGSMKKLLLLLLLIPFIATVQADPPVGKKAAKEVDKALDIDKGRGGKPLVPGANGQVNSTVKQATRGNGGKPLAPGAKGKVNSEVKQATKGSGAKGKKSNKGKKIK